MYYLAQNKSFIDLFFSFIYCCCFCQKSSFTVFKQLVYEKLQCHIKKKKDFTYDHSIIVDNNLSIDKVASL